MVLTILADGGSGRRYQVTVGNKEIYLEDVEALEFLWKKTRMTGAERRWTDKKMTERQRESGRERENQIFVSAEFILC